MIPYPIRTQNLLIDLKLDLTNQTKTKTTSRRAHRASFEPNNLKQVKQVERPLRSARRWSALFDCATPSKHCATPARPRHGYSTNRSILPLVRPLIPANLPT